VEKQEKQHQGMRMRIIRDKLASRRGKRDVILQQLTLSSKFRKKPDTTLLEKLENNEDEIEKLGLELEQQQHFECDRQSRLFAEKKRSMLVATTSIEMATPMIGTSGSFGSRRSGIESSTSENEDIDSSGSGRNNRMDIDDTDRNDNTRPPASTPNITICMECNLIPTNHTCLKCKQVRVCSVCCDANRGLQNNPWSKTCFENETPASQAMIRNGNYNYY
jgi:hypothetical protein